MTRLSLDSDACFLITGGTGFIGSHLVRALVHHGVKPHVITRSSASGVPWRLRDLRGYVHLHEADLRDGGAVDDVLRDVEPRYVLHLAAYTHAGKAWSHLEECVDVNVRGTMNLLRASHRVAVARFAYVSSTEVYGHAPIPYTEDAMPEPASPYATTKLAGEYLSRNFAARGTMEVRIARPSNVYGPSQTADRVVPELICRALESKDLSLTSGRQTREFCYVSDIVPPLLELFTAPGLGDRPLNLGSGEETSILDLAQLIVTLTGGQSRIRPSTMRERPNEVRRMLSDSSAAATAVNWRATHHLRDGLAKTIEWYSTSGHREVMAGLGA